MNQGQWQILKAMGLQPWQSVAVGEQRQPVGVHEPPHEPPLLLVVAQSRDLIEHRQLFESIASAVSWRPCDYLLIDDIACLEPSQVELIQRIWWCGKTPQVENFSNTAQHIESASFSELQQNRQLKADLWSKLKEWKRS